ncbi:uncharacterized protein VP01_3695g1, partial [Puccinia sorghi]
LRKKLTILAVFRSETKDFSFHTTRRPRTHRNFVPNHHHQNSNLSFSFSKRASISGSNAPTPMDLDALDVSKARCYNFNKIGQLSKDCPSPRKIKFNNNKSPVKPQPKTTLNLINLKPPNLEPKASTSDQFSIECYEANRFDRCVANMNCHLWDTAEQEKECRQLCEVVESKLNPRALQFIPGALALPWRIESENSWAQQRSNSNATASSINRGKLSTSARIIEPTPPQGDLTAC